jgi:hypothetical protein
MRANWLNTVGIRERQGSRDGVSIYRAATLFRIATRIFCQELDRAVTKGARQVVPIEISDQPVAVLFQFQRQDHGRTVDIGGDAPSPGHGTLRQQNSRNEAN